MLSMKKLLNATPTTAKLYVEHPDGSRNPIGDAASLPLAKTALAQWLNLWRTQGPNRQTTMTDNLTATLSYKGSLVAIAYIDPLPDRGTHAGDIRIDRKAQKRRPIA